MYKNNNTFLWIPISHIKGTSWWVGFDLFLLTAGQQPFDSWQELFLVCSVPKEVLKGFEEFWFPSNPETVAAKLWILIDTLTDDL